MNVCTTASHLRNVLKLENVFLLLSQTLINWVLGLKRFWCQLYFICPQIGEISVFTFIQWIQTCAFNEGEVLQWLNLPGEALWAIEWSVPCSRAVLLVPPLYPKLFLSLNRTSTSLPPQSLSAQSEMLHGGAAGTGSICVHLKGPSPAAGHWRRPLAPVILRLNTVPSEKSN